MLAPLGVLIVTMFCCGAYMLQQWIFYPHFYAQERSQAESWALLRHIELAGDFRSVGTEGYHYEANETLPNENLGYF